MPLREETLYRLSLVAADSSGVEVAVAAAVDVDAGVGVDADAGVDVGLDVMAVEAVAEDNSSVSGEPLACLDDKTPASGASKVIAAADNLKGNTSAVALGVSMACGKEAFHEHQSAVNELKRENSTEVFDSSTWAGIVGVDS